MTSPNSSELPRPAWQQPAPPVRSTSLSIVMGAVFAAFVLFLSYGWTKSATGALPVPWAVYAAELSLLFLVKPSHRTWVFLTGFIASTAGLHLGGWSWGLAAIGAAADGIALVTALVMLRHFDVTEHRLLLSTEALYERLLVTLTSSGAAGGLLLYVSARGLDDIDPLRITITWFLERLMGLLIALPVFLIFRAKARPQTYVLLRQWDTWMLALISGVLAAGVPGYSESSIKFVLLPLMVAAVRKGFPGVAVSVLVVGLCASSGLQTLQYVDVLQLTNWNLLFLYMAPAGTLLLPLIAGTAVSANRAQVLTSMHKESKIHALYTQTPVMMHSQTRDGALTQVSAMWLESSGYQSSNVIGRQFSDFLTPKSQETLKQQCSGGIHSEVYPVETPLQFVTHNGTVLDLLVRAVPEIDSEGAVSGVLVVLDNVTESVKVSKELAIKSELNRVVLESLASAVVVIDRSSQISYLNPAAELLLGVALAQAQGAHVADWISLVHQDTGEESMAQRLLNEVATVKSVNLSRSALITKDGREIPVRGSLAPTFEAGTDQSGAVLVLHNNSEATRLSREMVHLARHDALTGLHNRSVLQEKLELACSQASGGGTEFSLFFLDLDGFKNVNDTRGHATGDALLKAVAGRLRSCVRATDVVCRLGGDEFVVILSAPIDERSTLHIAQKMVDSISERFVLGTDSVKVSTSLGIARFPAHAQDSGTLQSRADAAMYAAKREGKNRLQLYSADAVARSTPDSLAQSASNSEI